MTEIKDIETAIDMNKYKKEIKKEVVEEPPKLPITESQYSKLKIGHGDDLLDGLPKHLMFTIDDGNNRGSLTDITCPYSKNRLCRKQYCGVWSNKYNQCALVANLEHQSPHMMDRKSTNEKSKEDNLLDLDFVDALQEGEESNCIPFSSPTSPSKSLMVID